jgi:amino acid transporter
MSDVTVKPDKAAEIERDKHDLHGFGYAQQLFRDMGGFANFAISFSIISILTGAITLYYQGINNGGLGMIGIGWPLITIMVMLVSASMAELSSSIPTAGALYHWSSLLGGRAWGWWTAWFNFIGQFTITAGISFGAALLITPLIFDADAVVYENTPGGKLLLVFAVILLTQGLINTFGARVVSWFAQASAIYHMVVVGAILFAFYLFADFGSASQVFDISNLEGSGSQVLGNPIWFAFLLGLLQAQWTYTGYDASAHISEETVNPRVRAPWGVFMSVAVSGFFGFIMLFTVTWAITDTQPILEAGTSAFSQIFYEQFSSTAADAFIWAIFLAMWFCGMSSVTSNSRLLFAFARDKGMPASARIASVSPTWRAPVVAIWVAVVLAFLCGLYAKSYAILTSISVIGLYVSYAIPVFLRERARSQGKWQPKHDGPWSLGKLSRPIARLMIVWVSLICVIFVLPGDSRTPELVGDLSEKPAVFNSSFPYLNGSYQVLTSFAFILLLLFIYWKLGPSKTFRGPRHMGAVDELERIEHELEAKARFKEGSVSAPATTEPA